MILDFSQKYKSLNVEFSADAVRRSAQIVERIEDVNPHLPDGWPVGYEQEIYSRASQIAISCGRAYDVSEIVPGMIYKRSKSADKIYARPSPELCLFKLWHHDGGECPALTRASIEYLAARIGTEIRWREMYTTQFKSGHRIRFAAAAEIDTALDRFVARFNEPVSIDDVMVRCAQLYMMFLLIHPFRDGNGFAARALLQLYLNHAVRLKSPIVTILPIYYNSLDLYQFGYLEWSINNRGDHFVRSLADSIERLIDLYLIEFGIRA
ncbi:MAG: Fic family protein [Pseudomonadota bacterium]